MPIDELLAGLGKLKIKANADEVNDRANRAALVKRVDAMLEVADTNKDGKIDFGTVTAAPVTAPAAPQPGHTASVTLYLSITRCFVPHAPKVRGLSRLTNPSASLVRRAPPASLAPSLAPLVDEFVIAYSVLKKMGNETSTSGFMNRYLGGVGALAFFVGKQYKEKTDMVGVKDKDEEEARRMVEELTDSQRTQLRGEFEKFDTDGNGTIEPAELMEAIRSLGVRVVRRERVTFWVTFGRRGRNRVTEVRWSVVASRFPELSAYPPPRTHVPGHSSGNRTTCIRPTRPPHAFAPSLSCALPRPARSLTHSLTHTFLCPRPLPPHNRMPTVRTPTRRTRSSRPAWIE